MSQAQPDYTFGIASVEILLLLLATFLLGMLLCRVLRHIGVCCSETKPLVIEQPEHITPVFQPPPEPISVKPKATREFPTTPNMGGYTADINSLLRGDPNMAPPPRSAPTPRPPPVYVETPATATSSSFTTNVSISPTVLSLGGGRKDDLKLIEGVGPRIEQILNVAGIQNFDQLAVMTPDALRPLLVAAGSQFSTHDPKSWPYQAELAAKGEWDRLKEYQTLLIGGKEI